MTEPEASSPSAASEVPAARTPAAGGGPLLDSAFMRKLEQWTFALRRTSAGQYGGERRSRRLGQSVEFADFRNYVPGDDTRFVDWNLYARLERLFLKLFLHEQELEVHILVDLSESMTFGEPSKSRLARRLAAALGYLALARQDGLSISVGCGEPEGRSTLFPAARGRGWAPRMLAFLESAPEGGGLEIGRFVERQSARLRRPGLAIVVSDFLEPGAAEAALAPLVARRHEAIVLHVLDREEWEPTLTGDLKLMDAEGRGTIEASLTPAALAQYRSRARAWGDGIEAHCTKRGVAYLRVLNDAAPQEVVLKSLRSMGRLR